MRELPSFRYNEIFNVHEAATLRTRMNQHARSTDREVKHHGRMRRLLKYSDKRIRDRSLGFAYKNQETDKTATAE